MIAIYTRQSLDKKDSISIETQVEFCKREFNESENEYKVYTDKGYSGKNTNRPDFEKMMADINLGLITKVIVYKLDRISRSTLDFATMYALFKRKGVEFISCHEKFDTTNPIGKTMLSIIIAFAELERETTQLRITDNYYARGKKGFCLGGPVPYGLSKEKTSIDGVKTSVYREHPVQSPIVKKMYEMYADTNMSLGGISDYLNKKGILAAQGGHWDSGKISRILRNPIYVKANADVYSYYKSKGCVISNDIADFVGINGCFLYGKREANERKYTKVEKHVLSIGLHKGIINSSQWLLVQYKLDKNKQIKNSGKGKHTWLSGIAKCGYCQYAVSVVAAGGKKYFNCRGKTNLKICDGHSIPIMVPAVEAYVEKSLLKRIEELKNVSFEVKTEDDVKVNQIKLQILEIDQQIENLLNQIAEGNSIVTEYINKKISSLDSTKNILLEKMRKITVSSNKNLSVEEMVKKFTDWDNMGIEDRKELCGWLINKVFITDNNINIDWKF
ncbi:MAG: recombinase family protein [Clostridiales bacterium]|nr:recombinase family protein [Clostridiales bacterium]